ncbi:hypothetical protein CANARDRAFT_23162 [[Candida] arabinofermentans NRRL YB-2248]|uniref:Eukaryotic translation initiation factor 3 subunit A n=1 Tax=[Candida] arabinofermentans NRRL YB-2248 TaxID=983967 RepID=A0A1E4T1K5_9ASCO|nr:hypothetical protein CANARDRAFT_23162 [[Candida] arabinofermentans NRRL YB-2248]
MAPSHIIRPENILRRAEDLIAVDQRDAALQTLYDFVTSKRTRSLLPVDLEPIAILFVTLGVELRNGKLVKDGLHQYKKNVQANEKGLSSVENVTKKFLEIAESKLNEAQSKADAANAAYDADQFHDDVDEDDDDDESSPITISPEDILMSTVSTDDTKDRSDRELVVPWLKFLWEAFRTVLDILRNNSKLEIAYASVVSSAFQFCVKYNRKAEFRRLCEMLRTHLQSVSQKPLYNKQIIEHPIDLSDPETLQRYLETRFNQLNVSVKLELWQESFRSVEDVHTLMSVSKRQPKPAMMINYYENLAKIFAVSENHLFHAAARERFFSLFVQSPIATEDELKHFASLQLLSALSVQQINESSIFAGDDFNKRKNHRLASLLNLSRVPTRESLLAQILSKDLLTIVDPILVKLYNLLEDNFHPLSFSKNVKDIFAEIELNKDYKSYIKPLLTVVLNKLFEQVSEVYETVKLDFLIKLATFEGEFKLSSIEIQSYLLNAASSNILSAKIDHESKVVAFKSDPFDESLSYTDSTSISNSLQLSPSELIRYQLSSLAKTLSSSVKLIDPSIKESEIALRDRSLKAAQEEFDLEREALLKRSELLEAKQKEIEELKRIEEEEAAKAKIEKQIAMRKAEQERMEIENAKRAEEKKAKLLEAIKIAEKQKLINDVNSQGIITLDINEVENIDAQAIRQMQVEKLDQDRKALDERNEVTYKRIDYLERAQRQYELTFLQKDAEEQKGKELEIYQSLKSKLTEKAKKEHEQAIQIRDRLKRVVPDYKSFVDELKSKSHVAYLEEKKLVEEKLQAAKDARIAEFIAKKKAEFEAAQKLEQAKIAAEKAREAELERIKKEEEEFEAKWKTLSPVEKIQYRKMGKVPASQRAIPGTAPAPMRSSPIPSAASSTPMRGEFARGGYGSSAPAPAPGPMRGGFGSSSSSPAASAASGIDAERAEYERLKAAEADGSLKFNQRRRFKELTQKFA